MILSPTMAEIGRQFQQSVEKANNLYNVHTGTARVDVRVIPVNINDIQFAFTREGLPQFNGEPLLAVFVEAVGKVDAGALVIASEQEEVFRIFDLVGEKSDDIFQVLFASVYIVSKEKVVGLGRESSVLKQTEQVVILSVSIPANLSRDVKKGQYKTFLGLFRVGISSFKNGISTNVL